MFICDDCGKVIGPGVKPVRIVAATRPMAYHNEYLVEDEWGNREKRTVDSKGYETERELFVCSADAKERGLDVVEGKQTTLGLSYSTFREKPAESLSVRMIAMVVHNALTRVQQVSKRAAQDSMVAVPLVKRFTDNNPKYVF